MLFLTEFASSKHTKFHTLLMFLFAGPQDGGTGLNRAVLGNTASGTLPMVPQIAKYICLKLQDVFVSNCRIHLYGGKGLDRAAAVVDNTASYTVTLVPARPHSCSYSGSDAVMQFSFQKTKVTAADLSQILQLVNTPSAAHLTPVWMT